MTKLDLVRLTSAASRCPQTWCERVIEAFLRLVPELVSETRTIELRRHGTYYISWRKERVINELGDGKSGKPPEHMTLKYRFPYWKTSVAGTLQRRKSLAEKEISLQGAV